MLGLSCTAMLLESPSIGLFGVRIMCLVTTLLAGLLFIMRCPLLIGLLPRVLWWILAVSSVDLWLNVEITTSFLVQLLSKCGAGLGDLWRLSFGW